jgi:acetyltransferase-like isoleucine patch superfamily enzyme
MFLTTITGYTMEKHTVAQKRRLRIACWGGGGPVVIGENVWIGDDSVIIDPANDW